LNRFESIFWCESNRNYFWRIGMHYHSVRSSTTIYQLNEKLHIDPTFHSQMSLPLLDINNNPRYVRNIVKWSVAHF